jgi:hypothetical protein
MELTNTVTAPDIPISNPMGVSAGLSLSLGAFEDICFYKNSTIFFLRLY